MNEYWAKAMTVPLVCQEASFAETKYQLEYARANQNLASIG